MCPTPKRLVVVNASPLLYLHLVGHLELLKKLYSQVVVPPAVARELDIGAERGVDVPDLSLMGWVRVVSLRSDALIPAVTDLGSGEAEVIGLGRENQASLVVIDDRLGRRIAKICGLAVTGTIGVLLKAKQERHLPAIAPVIQALQGAGLWLSEELVSLILRKTGEGGLL